MKKIIKKVLAEFGKMQANLESEAMQDMITDKIAREVKIMQDEIIEDKLIKNELHMQEIKEVKVLRRINHVIFNANLTK